MITIDEETISNGRIFYPRNVNVPESVSNAVNSAKLWRNKSVYIKPMTGGLNNENWYVKDENRKEYFLKVPGVGTEYIDRAIGNSGTERASDLGIGPHVYEFDADSGIEITEFLEEYDTCTTSTLRTVEEGLQVMKVYRTLHSSTPFARTNTLFEQVDQHLKQIKKMDVELPSWISELVHEYLDVRARFISSGLHIVPCHNDPMPGNFMTKSRSMKIIDFEFCGNNEESCELGLFLSEMFYEDRDSLPLIEEYFGKINQQSFNRVRAARVVGDIKWGLWGLINSEIRDAKFDYWKYGIWKLMRAYTYKSMVNWDEIKRKI